jgi:tartrate dehydratase beta subunit/fumarate hydratase class I family protein
MMSINQLVCTIAIPIFAFMQGGPDFNKTISQAMEQASTEQRQLMLYFTSEPCSKCKSLDTYLNQQQVQEALSENYVIVKVDIEDFDGRACREIYEVTDVPALVVIDINGNIVYKSVGDVTKEDIEPIVSTGILPDYNANRTVASVPKPHVPRKARKKDQAFAIQIGYFSSSENADKLKKQVMSEGYADTMVKEEQKKDKTFYRVLVGDYDGAEIAQADLKKLKQSGFSVKVHKYRP